MSDWKFLNRHRIRDGLYGSDELSGFNGAFILRLRGAELKVIASDGGGWRHVSVSLAKMPTYTPTWEIMCAIKDLFWEPEDCVVQYHPPKDQYVNNHPGCLHLWQPLSETLPTPPAIMVGLLR